MCSLLLLALLIVAENYNSVICGLMKINLMLECEWKADEMLNWSRGSCLKKWQLALIIEVKARLF